MSDAERLDPRIRRTRRLLQEAVLALAEDYDFPEITVAQIAQAAGVNRNTFYLHYRDKDHLLDQALDGVFEDLVRESRVSTFRTEPLTSAIWTLMLRHIQLRPRLFKRLLSAGGSTAFSARWRAYQEEKFLQIWNEREIKAAPGSPPAELRAKFAAGIAQAAVRWWLDEGRGVEVVEVAEWSWAQFSRLWYEQTGAPASSGEQ